MVLGLAGVSSAKAETVSRQPHHLRTDECHPNYLDACLSRTRGDYDCHGGRGDGPNYVIGPIRVVGGDPFRLDRDGDGIACEPKK